MTKRYLSMLTLTASILCLAGCGTPETGTTGSGGAGAGGSAGTGGSSATGGTTGGSGTGGADASGTGGSSATGTGGAVGSGGVVATGGAPGTGGAATGGAGGDGGSAAGGRQGMGGRTGGASGGNSGSGGATGGGGAAGGRAGGSGGVVGTGGSVGTGGGSGTCTASKAAGSNASGSGPHKVTVETNADPGISEGTIIRPTDLGGTEKYPIFVWGEGGCSQNGLSNSAAMGEIASHGYFVIADGTPNGSGNRSMAGSDPSALGKPLLAYITWAIAENAKPCSAYYQALDTTKVSANGFSCGGLMAEGTAGDSRITTWGINSSGLTGANQAFYKTIHTPVLIVLGGSGDVAYTNGERDYDNIAALGIPVILFSKALGHGGDLFTIRGGDFAKIDLAWLNWQLKGDETATGKGLLVGAGCSYCSDSAWEVKSANLP